MWYYIVVLCLCDALHLYLHINLNLHLQISAQTKPSPCHNRINFEYFWQEKDSKIKDLLQTQWEKVWWPVVSSTLHSWPDYGAVCLIENLHGWTWMDPCDQDGPQGWSYLRVQCFSNICIYIYIYIFFFFLIDINPFPWPRHNKLWSCPEIKYSL